MGGASRCSARIERAPYPSPTALQHVRIDHRRTDVLVPQEFLHGPNDVVRGRETVRSMLALTSYFRSLLAPLVAACRLA